ncbi:MAG: STAS domain-containing protein [Gammaproteobacteria bacterium]|nr:STAS domain-containing protein [Gammaproteobacteria bacterium]MCP5408356.1 STAS domain-containing protein [Chromatiaceae bacterium]MCP5442153.1 STAS domain-containing protein [Chromatiaceae bacterium]
MPITSSVSDDGREISIRVEGRFDFSLHKSFREAYSLADARKTRYQIDLSRAEYIDSAALGMLLLLRERAGGDDASIRISGCRDEIQRILQVSRFHELFHVE